MKKHITDDTFFPAILKDDEFDFYTPWDTNIDYSKCAKWLGIDKDVLRLGFYLFEGFPEDKMAIRDIIRDRIKIMESIAVGRDVSAVCPDFVAWAILDDTFGIVKQVVTQQAKDILSEIAIVIEVRESKRLHDLKEKIIQLSLIEKKVESLKLHWTHFNMMESAAHACTVFDDFKIEAFFDFATSGLNGSAVEVAMQNKFLLLLQ